MRPAGSYHLPAVVITKADVKYYGGSFLGVSPGSCKIASGYGQRRIFRMRCMASMPSWTASRRSSGLNWGRVVFKSSRISIALTICMVPSSRALGGCSRYIHLNYLVGQLGSWSIFSTYTRVEMSWVVYLLVVT